MYFVSYLPLLQLIYSQVSLWLYMPPPPLVLNAPVSQCTNIVKRKVKQSKKKTVYSNTDIPAVLGVQKLIEYRYTVLACNVLLRNLWKHIFKQVCKKKKTWLK